MRSSYYWFVSVPFLLSITVGVIVDEVWLWFYNVSLQCLRNRVSSFIYTKLLASYQFVPVIFSGFTKLDELGKTKKSLSKQLSLLVLQIYYLLMISFFLVIEISLLSYWNWHITRNTTDEVSGLLMVTLKKFNTHISVLLIQIMIFLTGKS